MATFIPCNIQNRFRKTSVCPYRLGVSDVHFPESSLIAMRSRKSSTTTDTVAAAVAGAVAVVVVVVAAVVVVQ